MKDEYTSTYSASEGAGQQELLPCPFCGSNFLMGQEPHDNGYVAGMFYIYHDYGALGSAARKCLIEVPKHFTSREEAIAAWNSRK